MIPKILVLVYLNINVKIQKNIYIINISNKKTGGTKL